MNKFFAILLVFFQVISYAQNMKNIDKSIVGEVEIISGIPIYMYAVPADDYENSGKAITMGNIIKIVLNEENSLSKKLKEAIEKASERNAMGKTADFDALEIRVSKERAFGVKYKGENTLKAYIEKVHNIPVFIYSKPVKEYSVVAEMPANFSKKAARGLLHDKIKSMLKLTLEKQEKGAIGQFDAVIINPDDLSETLIKFK